MNATNTNGRPIGVGVVGTGFGRSTQIPAFLATEKASVVAVVSHSRERAVETAREFGIAHAFESSDYDKFLALDELDLVCVTSPTDTHCDYTVRALAAGKHVLCEKPTAMNAGEAQRMLEAAQKSDRLALIDHELRFAPVRRLFRDLVTEGYVGRLLHVNLSVESPYRLDATRAWSWWSDATRGGGFLGALGSHVVDAVRFTFGEIVSARGQLRTFVTERPDGAGGKAREVTSDDYVALWLELEDGATVSAVLSAASRVPRPGWRMSAHGTDGSLILETDDRLIGQPQGEDSFTDLTPEEIPFDAKELGMNDTMWSRAFIVYAAEIISALSLGRNEVRMGADFEDGLRVQQVLDALRQSSDNENWVACGPTATASTSGPG